MALAITLVILTTAYLASRPIVTNFVATARLFFSAEVQKRAWQEAKRVRLEKEIEQRQNELEQVKPQSFWRPVKTVYANEKSTDEMQQELNRKVTEYLKAKGSPLADYVPTLLAQNNWEKILAIANAESSLCKRYPKASANCWGIGGEKLWDLGNNLGEGIVAANSFLNNYPRGSKKYRDMTVEEMNGLYKQPYGKHWSDNNNKVLAELKQITKNQ
jgi:hypothetical protein